MERMRVSSSRIAISTLLLAAGILSAQPLLSQKTSGNVLSEDKGKLTIMVDGQTVGSEDFSISRNGAQWVARGTTDFRGQTGANKVTGELHLNNAGAPLSYIWSSEGDKKATSTTTFEGMTAKISLDVGKGGAPYRQDFTFSSPVVVLDNNLYHQYEILARIYDWGAGGVQNFAVLIPQEQSPGTITAESRGSATLDGVRYEQLAVHTPALELMLYLDSSHRLMRLSVPAAKAEVRRQ
jgi:hypothetical protein